jgi:hypothetical protein
MSNAFSKKSLANPVLEIKKSPAKIFGLITSINFLFRIYSSFTKE